MPYRSGSGERRIAIRYGPLRRMRLEVGFVVFLVSCSAVCAGIALGWKEIRCTRASGRCVVTHGWLGIPFEQGAFAIDEVRDLELVRYESRAADFARTRVTLEDGGVWRVADASRPWAEDRHEALRLFLEEGRWSFVEARASKGLGLLCPAIGVLGLAALLMGSIVRPIRGITLEVHPADRLLRVREHRLLRRSTLSERSLDGVVDVRVEEGVIQPQNRRIRRFVNEPAGRIVLVTEDGEEHPLTDDLLLGTEVHHRAARELRDAIDLDAGENDSAT